MFPKCAGAPVAGEGSIVPRLRNARLRDVDRATTRAAAVVGQRLHDLVAEIDVHPRIAVVFKSGEMMEPHVPAAAVVGVVAGEQIEQRADRRAEDVAGAGAENFQSTAIRAETDHAAVAMLHLPAVGAGRLHETEIAARDVEPAVDAEAESVGRVIGRTILEAERDAGDQRLLLVGLAVAVVVDEHADIRRMHHVEPVVVPHHAARGIDVLHEFGHLVGAAVLVCVAQPNDPPAVRLAADRAVAIAGHVNIAARRGGDIDRVVRRGCGREQAEVKSLRHLHVAENRRLFLRRELLDLRDRVAALLIGIGDLRLFRLRDFRKQRPDALAHRRDFVDARPAALRGPTARDLEKLHLC